jgi:muramoyltetrapeptide carboxypeptidase
MTPIAPPRLRRGDRIGIVAPSGPVRAADLVAGARALESAGFRVVMGRHVGKRRGHLAGPDAVRASDLNRMLRDPDIRCLLMARGGYGSLRIAADVDWSAMRRDPKIFAGFSDATLLHLGFSGEAGVRTLHGPNLAGLGAKRGSEFRRWLAWTTEPRPVNAVRTYGAPRRRAGSARPARGRVLGGNLVLVHYAATSGLLPPLRGQLLFLEEVNEPPYKVDGMLASLRNGGWLQGVAGVALGDFTRCVPRPGRRELPLAQVLRDHLGALSAPAWQGIRAGHGRLNLPLPLGAVATLARGRLTYEEGLVS